MVAAHTNNEIVEAAIGMIGGGQSKLAARLAVSQQQISRLLRNKNKITGEIAIAIEHATDGQIPRWRIRPDLWPAPGKEAQ